MWLQMRRRVGENPQNHIDTLGAGVQCQHRLETVFRRQARELASGDVGRIGDDDVVAHVAEPSVEIGLN